MLLSARTAIVYCQWELLRSFGCNMLDFTDVWTNAVEHGFQYLYSMDEEEYSHFLSEFPAISQAYYAGDFEKR